MNTLETRIQQDLVSAMKSKDEIRMNTLRGVKTAIMESKTAKNGNQNPEDSDILKILQKMVKERNEVAEVYKTNGRTDLAEKETKEAEIIKTYLPKTLSEQETIEVVEKVISETGANSMKDMGKVMGYINKTYSGQIDGSFVSKIVKEKLMKQ